MTIKQWLARLDKITKEYDDLPIISGGPIGMVYDAIGVLIEQASQGSGQSCAEEDDSLWNNKELGQFVRGLTPLLDLLREV